MSKSLAETIGGGEYSKAWRQNRRHDEEINAGE